MTKPSNLTKIQTKTLKAQVLELAEKIIETKEVLVLVGKNKKPVDRDDAIIFHIDI